MALAATVAVFSIGIVLTLHFAAQSRRELAESYQQLRNLYLIESEANYLVEQIAELLILGPQDAEMHRAYTTLAKRLATQRRFVSAAVDRISDPEKRAKEGHELDRINQIKRVVRQLDDIYQKLEGKLAAGRRGRAASLYNDRVENDLDNQLEALIASARARERNQVEHSIAASERLAHESLWLAVGMAVIIAALGLGNVLMLNRTVLRPIMALAAAADAVGRGELSHIVSVGGTDELGHLTQRFNRMTGQIKVQRDALQRTNANLEQQVAERTRELVARSAELESLNARLREVDASRARFFADISHELRTPLTVVRGQAEVVLRRHEPDPTQMRKTLEAIVRKADQMGRLVEDMLFLARSEAGAIKVEMRPTVLQETIADALIDSQTFMRGEGVLITPRQPVEPVIVRGDGERLRQALVIVLDNALKFAPENTAVAIELAATREHATIRVLDSGPGFSMKTADRAFTRFAPSESGRGQDTGRGAGLGLAIAKWIVDQHGGSITIESTSGAGAMVAIELPLASESA